MCDGVLVPLEQRAQWSRTGHQLVSYTTSDVCFYICDMPSDFLLRESF